MKESLEETFPKKQQIGEIIKKVGSESVRYINFTIVWIPYNTT